MIHQYQLGGYNVVLDVCSGSVHVVDPVAYDMIGMYEASTWEQIREKLNGRYPQFSNEELRECYDQIT